MRLKNLCCPQRLFSAITQNQIENSPRLYVEGTRATLTSALAYRKYAFLAALRWDGCRCVLMSVVKGETSHSWFWVTLVGSATSVSISLIGSHSEFLPGSRARLMAEGRWGFFDWEVTDSAGVRGGNLSPGYLSDSWLRLQDELERRLGRENHSQLDGAG